MSSTPFKSIASQVNSDIANNGTFTLAYPAGTSAKDYAYSGHAIAINQAVWSYPTNLGIAFGATLITVTNKSGATWARGSSFILQLNADSDSIKAATVGRTLVIADAVGLIYYNSASDADFTIPNDTTVAWAGNAVVAIYIKGAGIASLIAGSGVTLNANPSSLPDAETGSVVAAMRVGSNEWTQI